MIIEVIDSWLITGRFTVVEVKHFLDGFPPGTEFTDGKTLYHIDKRMIFSHTASMQKEFKCEETIFTSFSFGSSEAMDKSARDILEKEARNIFQYTLKEKIKPGKGFYEVYNRLD